LLFLRPRSGGAYLDATVGGGGHAEAILEESRPHGRLLGLDRDPEALARAGQRLGRFRSRALLVKGSFADLSRHLDGVGWRQVSGAVADLGLSSLQLADTGRGFSFSGEAPLDMRFDPDSKTTAADLVNELPERELGDLIFRYGEERRSRAIARRIVARRPLATTTELRRAVVSATGPRRSGGVDPATRTFQALRIAVNRELEALTAFLDQALERLEPGGRLVVVSYHSLEDRAVKWAFRDSARRTSPPRFHVLTSKPVRPDREEIGRNRRARSAKLRCLERIA
ncbi:MAG: 16S rRNA (cytosine(1402)-N(4))-methyltransferase RsmH, partial [Acidobacteriota bacterium]